MFQPGKDKDGVRGRVPMLLKRAK